MLLGGGGGSLQLQLEWLFAEATLVDGLQLKWKGGGLHSYKQCRASLVAARSKAAAWCHM